MRRRRKREDKEEVFQVSVVSGKGELDGTYRLKEERGERAEEECEDGCIYIKVRPVHI